MGEPLLPIVAEISIAASLEQVWLTLVGAETVPRWLGAIDYRPEVGTTFFMQHDADKRARHETDGATWCDVLILQRPHRFNFSWYVPGTPQTIVQIGLFSEAAQSTSVRLIHDGWDDFEREAIEEFYEDIASGWRDDALPALKRLVESS